MTDLKFGVATCFFTCDFTASRLTWRMSSPKKQEKKRKFSHSALIQVQVEIQVKFWPPQFFIFYFWSFTAQVDGDWTPDTSTRLISFISIYLFIKMLKKCYWTCPFNQIHTKSQWGLLKVEMYPPSKFGGNPFCSFCVSLVTNQQTNRLRNDHKFFFNNVKNKQLHAARHL